MKKIIRLTESDLINVVKKVIEENKKEDNRIYFQRRGNEIQKSVLSAVKYAVNPYRIRNHSNYFKQVCEFVWMDVDWGNELPSKRDFMKFMREDFADQIYAHHTGLGR
jgi:uncharacterized protein Usg